MSRLRRHLIEKLGLISEADLTAALSKYLSVPVVLPADVPMERIAPDIIEADRDSAPGLIDLWEEATRVLPSHTWLTELRLETSDKQEQQMVMIGFSAAAPSLVGIVDGSSLFSDAALTAPVSLDPVERVERFALQAKVARSGQAGKAPQ